MSAPASMSWRVPSAVTTLPATIFASGNYGAHLLDRLQRACLVAVRRVDDEHVGAEAGEFLGLHRGVTVDADGGGDEQLAVGVDGRLIDRRTQRALARDHTDQLAVGVEHRRHPRGAAPPAPRRSRRGIDAGVEPMQVGAHHVAELGEAIDSLAVVLGEQPDRDPVVDHDHRAVGALVDQRQGIADRWRRSERDRACRTPMCSP